MAQLPIIVVNYLGGWRIRHHGGSTRKYKSQADAIKVAVEIARFSPERPQVLLQVDDVTFRSIDDARRYVPDSFITGSQKDNSEQELKGYAELAS